MHSGLGFRFEGLGLRVYRILGLRGLGCMGFRFLGFKVQGFGFRVWGGERSEGETEA